jgi:hypothetical protein
MLRDLLGRVLPPLTDEQRVNAALCCIRVSNTLSAVSIAALLEECDQIADVHGYELDDQPYATAGARNVIF